MIRVGKRGGALLAVLLIVPIVSCAILFLQKIKLGSFQREQIKQRLQGEETSGLIPPNILATQLTLNAPISTAPFLLFDNVGNTSSFLLRLNPTATAVPLHADWRRLSRLPPLTCPTYTNANLTRHTQAPKNCSGVSNPIFASSLIKENLVSSAVLNISPGSLETIIIAVAGEFSAPLQITLSGETRLELIAFGPIHISELTVTPRSDSSLLISSKAGTITIDQLNGTTVCNPSTAGSTQLRLESSLGLVLGGANQGALTLGCSGERSAEFWPKSQIMAVNWP